jgi:hypothetical protein
MSPDDEYSAVIDQSAADAVRALLVVPHASPEGARGLRQVTSWLAATHGPDAVRDRAGRRLGRTAGRLRRGQPARPAHGAGRMDPRPAAAPGQGAIDDQPDPGDEPEYPNDR